MTASEFAFMTLGLVLGGAVGAGLVFVIGARPPAPREIRLTVAADAIPRRVPATLSVDAFATVPAEPARGGPADRRSVDRHASPLIAAPPATMPANAGGGPPSALSVSGGNGSRIAIPIHREPDPAFQALRSSLSAPSATAVIDRVPIRGGGSESPWDVQRATFENRETDQLGGVPTPANPCADAIALVEERCRQAEVARLGADTAARAVGDVRREYDAQRSRADGARTTVEPRHVHELKEAARVAFRSDRRTAVDRAGMDAAARTWLTSINRLNAVTREAALALVRAEASATALMPTLERLSAEADAARHASEGAASACMEARSSLAECQEADGRGRDFAPASTGATTAPPPAPDRLSVAEGTPIVLRIVRGEREARTRVAAALSRDVAEPTRPWADLLAEFADAVRMRAIEESIIDVPSNHSFWSPFTRGESRDIVAALAALGYRYDGLGGWIDDRVPSQRDLSMAVGYAGQDPMRVRHWPSETDMVDLLREATVASDEFLEEAGGELSLSEVIDLLGPRADPLTGLWDAWGTVRPLLLAVSEDAPPVDEPSV